MIFIFRVREIQEAIAEMTDVKIKQLISLELIQQFITLKKDK